MYEVELKVRGEHAAVRAALEAAGASRIDRHEQVDRYYDAPDRSFAETDEALRLRREAGSHRLTYKGPLLEVESKSRIEYETDVADGGATDDILRALGFEPVEIVEKTRERYSFRGFTVSLDVVDGLGEFVEIETTVDEKRAVAPTRQNAAEALSVLDLDPRAQIRTSYLELLLE